MIAVEIKITSALTLAAVNSLTQPLQREAFESIGVLLLAAAKDNIRARSGPNGPWPSGPWTTLYAGARTWQDISHSLVVEVRDQGVVLGATHIAAGVRQLGTIGAGGTLPDIVPVTKKALTIPQNDAASRASYQGLTAREAFPDAFLLTNDGRHGASPLQFGVIARKVGGRTNRKTGMKENQQLEILYILVTRTAIRPHPFIPVTADGVIRPASLAQEIDELVINNFMKRVA